LTVTRVDKGKIELAGTCPSDDAETLFQFLLEDRSAEVDWSRCERAHTAVIQVLLASGCKITGALGGNFLGEYIDAALRRAGGKIRPFPAGL
jgi:hypothetical protein